MFSHRYFLDLYYALLDIVPRTIPPSPSTLSTFHFLSLCILTPLSMLYPPILLPLSYLRHCTTFDIVNYWLLRLIHFPFHWYTELPLALRPARGNDASPFDMTLYHIREALEPKEEKMDFVIQWGIVRFFLLFYVGFMWLPMAWWKVVELAMRMAPTVVGVWMLWEVRAALPIFGRWLVWVLWRLVVEVWRGGWGVWRNWSRWAPAAFIAWVVVTSPLREILRALVGGFVRCFAEVLYFAGDWVRDLVGTPPGEAVYLGVWQMVDGNERCLWVRK